MPIRPENKARYPKDWSSISQRIRQQAGNKCEECGVPNHELGGRDELGNWWKARPTGATSTHLTWPLPGDDGWCERKDHEPRRLRIVRIVLTVAHLDHTPENCADENLRAWCQRCHNRYDAAMRRAGIKSRARATAAHKDLFDDEGKSEFCGPSQPAGGDL